MVILQKEMFDAMIEQKVSMMKLVLRDLSEKNETLTDRVDTELFLDEIICQLIMRVNGIENK